MDILIEYVLVPLLLRDSEPDTFGVWTKTKHHLWVRETPSTLITIFPDTSWTPQPIDRSLKITDRFTHRENCRFAAALVMFFVLLECV